MKILLTNQSLAVRGGSEPFMRDLARCLQGRGHLVFCYSSDPCQQERLLERDLLAVATDLENLPFKPDVIHAQHHLDAMSALAALPEVPAVYHEHGGPWQQRPPLHPRIHHYLAASEPLARDMMGGGGIDPGQLTVFPHPVDQCRFQKMRRLPAEPGRALFLNRDFLPGGRTMQAVEAAARRCRLALDFAGRDFGCGSEEAEEILPEYDVVFASGGAATEALACGCAVVTVGPGGYGEMVTPDSFSRLRSANFSCPPDTDWISFEEMEVPLRCYDPPAAALLASRIRAEADFPSAVDRLLGIYQSAVALHRQAKPDSLAELRATAEYLRGLAPGIMKANNQATGLMRPKIVWTPTSYAAGMNPQK